MLTQAEVDAEEERLRQQAAALPDAQRADFYRELSKTLKDPDTYATTNYFFLVGLHHFYLGNLQRGLLDVALLVVGVGLLIASYFWLGGIVLLVLVGLELWTLARSQIIVQHWNNQAYKELLENYRS